MTVYEMCVQAALMSNRGEEFERETDLTYKDESLLWRTIFLAAINEAYGEAARKLGIPSKDSVVTPDAETGMIDLAELTDPVVKITRVMNADATCDIVFRQINRDTLQVMTDEDVTLRYTYLPEVLSTDDSSPDFPEEAVPPELYIFLAVARVYQSENKHKSAEPWLREYYSKLNKIRHVASGTARRVPARRFR